MERVRLISAGMRFGSYTVEQRAGNRYVVNATWRCVCDCGAVRNIKGSILKPGYKPECACQLEIPEPTPEAKIAYDRLVRHMVKLSGFDEAAIRGRARGKLIDAVRNTIAESLRSEGLSLPEIGAAMRRNHTTVMRKIRKGDSLGKLAVLLRERDDSDLRDTVSRWQAAVAETVPAAKASFEREERATYDRVLERLAAMPEYLRETTWHEFAKSMYPHSWERQQVPRLTPNAQAGH